MEVVFNDVILNVVGVMERDEDAFEVTFEINQINYKNINVTEIYESLDLISEISDICKEKLIHGKF